MPEEEVLVSPEVEPLSAEPALVVVEEVPDRCIIRYEGSHNDDDGKARISSLSGAWYDMQNT